MIIENSLHTYPRLISSVGPNWHPSRRWPEKFWEINEWQVFKSGFIKVRGLTLYYVICTTWSHFSIIPSSRKNLFVLFHCLFLKPDLKIFLYTHQSTRSPKFHFGKKKSFSMIHQLHRIFSISIIINGNTWVFNQTNIYMYLPTLILIYKVWREMYISLGYEATLIY